MEDALLQGLLRFVESSSSRLVIAHSRSALEKDNYHPVTAGKEPVWDEAKLASFPEGYRASRFP